MNARSSYGLSRSGVARWLALVLLPIGLLLGVADAAMASPPCWAPAHGYRAKHASHHRHCYRKRSHKRSRARGWRRHDHHAAHEHHEHRRDVLLAEEPYESSTAVEPASTNVTIAVGSGSSSAGSGIVGAVVGAALGGYLGSNVGNGSGQLAATAAGTLAGWVIGGEVARDPE